MRSHPDDRSGSTSDAGIERMPKLVKGGELSNAILKAISGCRHEIDWEVVSLHYDHKQPGHNALNQLVRRLVAAINGATGEVRTFPAADTGACPSNGLQSSRPTPRTDHLARELQRINASDWTIDLLAHAQTLERELAQKEEDRQYHMDHLNRLASFMGFHDTSEKEIDEAINRLKGAAESLKIANASADDQMFQKRENASYAVLLTEAVRKAIKHSDEPIADEMAAMLREALAKNPNPSGRSSVEPSQLLATEGSGLVGLGPERIPQVTLIQGGWRQVRMPKEPK